MRIWDWDGQTVHPCLRLPEWIRCAAGWCQPGCCARLRGSLAARLGTVPKSRSVSPQPPAAAFPCGCPGAPRPPSPALLKQLNRGIAARDKPGGRESWRGADWLWVQLPACRNPGQGGVCDGSGDTEGCRGSCTQRVFGESQLWVRVRTANSRHRGGGGHRTRALLLLPRGRAPSTPGSYGEHKQHPRVLPLPTRITWFLPRFPAVVPGVALPKRDGQGWGQRRGVPPALWPALPPAAWGGWRGQGMAAICRARLNNRPPRKISRPPPRPSIVFGTHCCFFRLLSYFS